MTVTRVTNAAIIAAYSSTRYTATTNGVSTPVLRITTQAGGAEYPLPGFWEATDVLECGFAKVMANEAVTLVLSAISGAMTSVRIFPRDLGKDAVLDSGVVSITLQPGQGVRIETDGERGEPCYFIVNELEATPSGTTYNGTQTSVSGVLIMPDGITNLTTTGAWNEKLLPLTSGCTFFLPINAWVIGSLLAGVGVANYTVTGPGVLSGEYITNAAVSALPTFQEKMEHTMIYSNFATTTFAAGGVVKNISIVNMPWYSIEATCSTISGLFVLAPWNDNCGQIGGLGAAVTYELLIENNIMWVGDDALDLRPWRGIQTVRNNFLCSSGSSCIVHSYWIEYAAVAGWTTTVTDTVVRAVLDYYLEEDGDTGGMVIQALIDGYNDGVNYTFPDVTYDGLRIETDENGINCLLLRLGNYRNTWVVPRDQRGRLSGWVMRNIFLDTTPTDPSQILALDFENATSGIAFENLVIGGIRVNARNFDQYFNIDEHCFNITFDGKGV